MLITPDNHDTLGNSFQVYEIASDDAGESRPAFMAVKEAVYPVQSEVTSLDHYIQPFVWGNGLVGGLQRTTNESSSYGVYGVPDWKTNPPQQHAEPRTRLRLSAHHRDVLRHVSGGEISSRNHHGSHGDELSHPRLWHRQCHVDLRRRAGDPGRPHERSGHLRFDRDSLQAEGFTTQAANLRSLWETKVAFYVSGNADLFASEYAFDSTGFESQQAYAKYALQHAGSDAAMGSGNVSAFLQNARQYMNTEITANVFDRGWLETAYYYYGSDYRGDAGDDYIVTYMAQMGGWGLLDYAFYYATNSPDYLRLGIASYLNGWSTMNTGTPASNYGFWYPGVANRRRLRRRLRAFPLQ